MWFRVARSDGKKPVRCLANSSGVSGTTEMRELRSSATFFIELWNAAAVPWKLPETSAGRLASAEASEARAEVRDCVADVSSTVASACPLATRLPTRT